VFNQREGQSSRFLSHEAKEYTSQKQEQAKQKSLLRYKTVKWESRAPSVGWGGVPKRRPQEVIWSGAFNHFFQGVAQSLC
jgi:hypothetical protein